MRKTIYPSERDKRGQCGILFSKYELHQRFVFPSGFAASCVWSLSVAFPLPGLAMCTEWVRVEVRSGSVVKLFPGRSLHLRAFAFPSEKPSRDFLVVYNVQPWEAMRYVTRRNPWQLRECWNNYFQQFRFPIQKYFLRDFFSARSKIA